MRHILLLCLLAIAQAGRLAPHYHTAHGWVVSEAAAPEDVVRIGFGPKVSEENVRLGDTILASINDPKSPQFGRHLTVEQIHQTFGNVAALKKVSSFLESHGIKYTVAGDHAWADVPVHKLQELLKTKFFRHTHPHAGDRVAVRATFYHIPDELEEHIEIIYGVVHFPFVRKSVLTMQPTFFNDMNPSRLQQVYHVPNTLISGSSQSQTILSASSGYIPSDLSKFFQSTGSALGPLGLNYPLVLRGPNQTQDCQHQDCGESTLDLEYIMAMAPGIKTVLFNTRGDGFSELPNWLATDKDAPFVASASLGLGLDKNYARSQCNLVQKAALRGVSFFVASGDSGGLEDNCNPQRDVPSICPYMISIGGTDGANNNQVEAAWSGGGAGAAGDVFPSPDWQKSFVQSYRNKNPSGLDTRGLEWDSRVYPDFSAHAGGTMLIFQGKQSGAMGTSFACPIFAGIISQINHQRALNGKGPVGLLHQLVASLGGKNMTKDIKDGSSKGGKCGNFPATEGWDLATGFGSPDYNLLYNALVKGSGPNPTKPETHTRTISETYLPTRTATAISTGCSNSVGSTLSSEGTVNQITSDGGSLSSPDCNYELRIQEDGNIVLKDKSGDVHWAAGSDNNDPSTPNRLTMQPDGNLVGYDSNRKVLWSSRTFRRGQAPFTVTLDNDGKISLVDGTGKQTWSSE